MQSMALQGMYLEGRAPRVRQNLSTLPCTFNCTRVTIDPTEQLKLWQLFCCIEVYVKTISPGSHRTPDHISA